MAYKSKHTGAAIDEAIDAVVAKEAEWDAKQNEVSGIHGQLAGFDKTGRLIAQDPQHAVEHSADGNDPLFSWMIGAACNPNLLDNWYFANPVNQRGKREYTAGEYTVDRWVKSSAGTVTVADGYVTIGAGVTFQYRPEAAMISAITGRELTFSALTDTGLVTGTAVFTSAKLFSSDSKIELRISNPGNPYIVATADVNLIAVKLEFGGTQTLAHQEKDAEGNDIWVLNEVPDYAEQYAICKQYSPVAGDYIGMNWTNPNLLDNWYFLNPVNQRGKKEYSGKGHTIDRWYTTYDLTTVSLGDNGVTFTSTATSSSNGQFIQQYIEDPAKLLGQTVTLSALVEEYGLITATATLPTELPATSTQYCGLVFTPAVRTGLYFGQKTVIQLGIRALQSYTIKAIKLELGSTQTLAHQDASGNWVLNEIPDYSEELVKCQRYQAVYSFVDTGYYFLAYAISPTTARIFIPTPHNSLASIPTPIYDSGALMLHRSISESTFDRQTITNLSHYTSTPGVTIMTATVDSGGLVVGETYVVRTIGVSKLILDRNLL